MPEYLSGFGNLFASEALPGALPKGQNNPQKCPYGLFAEQLSGTAFTVPRKDNQRSWLYRGRPSAARCKSLLKSETLPGWVGKNFATDPNQMRWDPPQVVTTKNDIAKTTDFLDGVQIVGKAGDPCSKQGLAIYVYAANSSMANRCMSNSDGDLLLVPQAGGLLVRTEFGLIEVVPNEICVIQRGMWFQVELLQPKSLVRGYILEVYAQHFQLPELGPIGSNGLANPQDFYSPVACYDKDFPKHKRFHAYTKFGGEVFESIEDHTPFDVVAFRGNYVPFKYDLRKFMCINSVTYDHPDPSIYTVLTCPSSTPGVATADFVIFPPRWMVMENTFRPPWFHRNTMTEFMGMIWGKYDAKQGGSGGFVPGGASLHQCCAPHGPDAATFEAATNEELQPKFYDGGLAFMFETFYICSLSEYAREGATRQNDYAACWSDIKCSFREKDATNVGDNLLNWRGKS